MTVTKINLMQDLLHMIILDCKIWRRDKNQFDVRFITYNYLTVKYDDVTKINLMQDLLHIIILDCIIWRCDENQFDARFITYNYLRL